MVSSWAFRWLSKFYSSSKRPLLNIDESSLREDLFKILLFDWRSVDLSRAILLMAFSRGSLNGDDVYLSSILDGVKLLRLGSGTLGFCFWRGVSCCCCMLRCREVEEFCHVCSLGFFYPYMTVSYYINLLVNGISLLEFIKCLGRNTRWSSLQYQIYHNICMHDNYKKLRTSWRI